MAENRTYNLFLYNSLFLIPSMVGFAILGAGVLFIFQGILEIPAAIQYILLTLWMAADFLFSSYTAAKPTRINIDENGLFLESNLQITKIPWNDIRSHKFYNELLLNSLKIKLENKETISIIDFKWRGEKEIYGFMQSMYPHLAEEQMEEELGSSNKIKTFFRSNLKTILGIIFFMVFVNISSNLDDRGAFYTWNPIFLYFYWVLPILTFFNLCSPNNFFFPSCSYFPSFISW